MVFWWRFAVLMSEEDSHSRYYKSKLRFCPCSMCSHSLLRNGCVMTRHSKSGVPVTMVVQPLKHKCCWRRRVKFIVHSRDSRRVISLLLMLAGDVETNPGPLGNNNFSVSTFFLYPWGNLVKEITLNQCSPINSVGWLIINHCAQSFLGCSLFRMIDFCTGSSRIFCAYAKMKGFTPQNSV